jgi:hypothetical protein
MLSEQRIHLIPEGIQEVLYLCQKARKAIEFSFAWLVTSIILLGTDQSDRPQLNGAGTRDRKLTRALSILRPETELYLVDKRLIDKYITCNYWTKVNQNHDLGLGATFEVDHRAYQANRQHLHSAPGLRNWAVLDVRHMIA